MPEATISVLVEIPAPLHEALKEYCEKNSDWYQDRVFTAALGLFLVQNASSERIASRCYLDAMFKRGEDADN